MLARILARRPGLALARLLLSLLVALGAAHGAQPSGAPPTGATPGRTIEVFVRDGCAHCGEAEAFVAALARDDPALRVVVRDVGRDRDALDRLKDLAREAPGTVARVPAVYAGGQLIVGYSSQARTDRRIREALAGGRPAGDPSVLDTGSCAAEDDVLSCDAPAGAQEPFEIGVLGRTIALDDVGLPAFTLAMGLLDGFNPCSMWVLILMISLLAPLADRRRMLAIAGTFVAIQGVSYFLMMTAWLNLFLLIGLARWSEIAIGGVALVAGAINVKDYFAFGRGVSLSIPARHKADIYRRIKGLLHAESLAAAVIGTVVLGVLVQVVEFMCTSGFPALFTRILTLRDLDAPAYYGYLLLYNGAYMLDDVVILGIGVATLSRARLQEREGRWLKLVAGVVMIGLAVYLLA